MSVSLAQLTRQAQAKAAAGETEAALALYRQAAANSPSSAVAEHNLASALGAAGLWIEAEKHARSAQAKGLDAPELWVVLARCAQSLGRLDDAERFYVEAARRRPLYYQAQRELAQLRWMRTGDSATVLAGIESALAAATDQSALLLLKAQVLGFIGADAASFDLLDQAATAAPDDATFAAAAAQAGMAAGRMQAAVAHAQRAAVLAPADAFTSETLAAVLLAAGELALAAPVIESLRRRAPLDQNAIALQMTLWRLLDDPRYRTLANYDAFVGASQIEAPSGWPNLDAYLADLGQALKQAHLFQTHPFAQSIRRGSQAADIQHFDHTATRALPQALDGPIRSHLRKLGSGDDPVRARNTGAYRFSGMWSIHMPAGGYHIDHVHPHGWLSSACYIELPQGGRGHEGWLRFGKPGTPTQPALDAEHYVEPKLGRLVLFPSYMWHGTVPFSGDATRLTVAFDLVPA